MNSCKRCGTCCKNGGPALHKQDLHLFDNHTLQVENCVTIRKAEPAFSPLSQTIEPVKSELIKISGSSKSWQCCFFEENKNQCGIYANRPVECSLLQCWNTEALTNMVYTDTLTRSDLIEDKSLLEMISRHETLCSYSGFGDFTNDKDKPGLTKMINLDLSLRQEAVNTHGLSLSKELFLFGRPMFQSTSFYGVTVRQTPTGFEVI